MLALYLKLLNKAKCSSRPPEAVSCGQSGAYFSKNNTVRPPQLSSSQFSPSVTPRENTLFVLSRHLAFKTREWFRMFRNSQMQHGPAWYVLQIRTIANFPFGPLPTLEIHTARGPGGHSLPRLDKQLSW